MLTLAVLAVFFAALFGWTVMAALPKLQRGVIALCFGLLALAIYLGLGNPFLALDIANYRNEAEAGYKHAQEIAAKLDADPAPTGKERTDLLIELGNTWLRLQRYDEAEATFKEAVLTSEGDAEVVLSYGKAQMMNAGGMVNEGASKAFMLAAALMPENPEPLFFLAMEKAQKGDVKTAHEAMTTLAEAFPQNEKLQLAIKEELAKMKAEETPQADPAPAPTEEVK